MNDIRNLKEYYKNRAAGFALQTEREKKILAFISFVRLLVFLGGIFLVWTAYGRSVFLGTLSLFSVALLFMFLLYKYAFHSDRKEHLDNMEGLNNNEYQALSGDFSVFKDGNQFTDATHDFSFDTDIFGKSSLFQYLNRTSTGYGCEMLAKWLSEPYSLMKDFGPRREIIKEFAAKCEWRQEFQATGMNKNLDRKHISGLVTWLNDNNKQSGISGLLKFLIWFVPAANIVSLALVIAGVLHYSVFTLMVLISLMVSLLNLKKTNSIHNELTGRYRFLSSLGKLIRLLIKENFSSAELIDIQEKTGRSAVSSVKKLSRIIQAFDNRLNVLVGFVLNGLLLWDLHCIHRLGAWKSEYRRSFPEWLENLANIDAYISLGNYAFNNPGFAWPEISDDGVIFSGVKLGHPLIDPHTRVNNDFSLHGGGEICIISGPNMAGKSTFLRTVAVNFILAMTGAPVCAEKMTFTHMNLFTSMRTTDSLSSSESYFYAELRRLSKLMDKISNGERILFILDEILKGTNSEDKSTGSKLFLRRLLGYKATGLIATHDTSLGTLHDEFPSEIVNKCIEAEIDGDDIRFDYLLREGITTKKNAVLLMRQMGIIKGDC